MTAMHLDGASSVILEAIPEQLRRKGIKPTKPSTATRNSAPLCSAPSLARHGWRWAAKKENLTMSDKCPNCGVIRDPRWSGSGNWKVRCEWCGKEGCAKCIETRWGAFFPWNCGKGTCKECLSKKA